MPWIVVALIAVCGGCFFDGSYSGTVRCSDGQCPSHLVCKAEVCVTDTPIDTPPEAVPPEGPPPALTCADPGSFAGTGTQTGTTVGTTSKMSSSCGGFVNNGPDRVYQITMNGTNQLRVAISGGRKAYVLASCVESPSTPACLGNVRATEGNPIVVTPAVGPAFVVVDDETATASSTYSLTLTVL